MTLFIMYSTLITITLACLLSISPIALGITVLFIALLSSMTIAMTLTSWYALIMFIIYVGGMLVMFAYFAALQPNQLVTNWSWWVTAPTMFLVILLLCKPHPITLTLSNTSIKLLYYPQNAILLLFMAMLLFLALIAVVKVSRASEGPLRPFTQNYV